jgi:hypothetical protein
MFYVFLNQKKKQLNFANELWVAFSIPSGSLNMNILYRRLLFIVLLQSPLPYKILVISLETKLFLIQIKNDREKIYPNLPDNELFAFWQIIYLTPCCIVIRWCL